MKELSDWGRLDKDSTSLKKKDIVFFKNPLFDASRHEFVNANNVTKVEEAPQKERDKYKKMIFTRPLKM